MTAVRLLALSLVLALAAVLPATAAAAPPANDNRADAQGLEVPARVDGTTVEATVEEGEPGSACGYGSSASVYYEFRAGANGRLLLRLHADGDLDAVMEVFRRTRSQLTGVTCEPTDESGDAQIGVDVKDGETYLVRIAQRANSVSGTFTLLLDRATPPAQMPGAPLPAGGRRDSVEVALNPDDAWHVSLRAGVTYRINLVSDHCITLGVYGPGAHTFGDAPRIRKACGGYVVVTPRPDQAGRWVLRAQATHGRGSLPYSIEVAPAGDDDTAPGLFLRNLQSRSGDLRGNRIDVIDLYRFDVERRSTLDLRLRTRARFHLILMGSRGKRIVCACGGGTDIRRRIGPGRYFAAVRAISGRTGTYRLTRITRTITKTTVLINGHRAGRADPGSTLRIGVQVAPGVSGPVVIRIERFDPLAGWQFHSRIRTRVAGGSVVVPFRPPAVGRWRARVRFPGTRTAAPSRSDYAQVLVAGPLLQ